MAADEERDGVALTHLDQPLADDEKITKRELVDYLDAMSDRLLPVLADRPLSVIRVRPGQPGFMQKNLPKYAPDWIRRVSYWPDVEADGHVPALRRPADVAVAGQPARRRVPPHPLPERGRGAQHPSRARHRSARGVGVRRRRLRSIAHTAGSR